MIKLQTERIEDRNRTHGRARSRPYMTEFHKLKKKLFDLINVFDYFFYVKIAHKQRTATNVSIKKETL